MLGNSFPERMAIYIEEPLGHSCTTLGSGLGDIRDKYVHLPGGKHGGFAPIYKDAAKPDVSQSADRIQPLCLSRAEETKKDALRIQRVLIVQNVRRTCPWKFRWTGVA
jgi:hypothetical protein